jgi:hypothetical protein
MNKLIKNYIINIEYKTTKLLSYQSLMSHIDEMNQKRIHVYRQKVKSICYFAIITRSNIINIAFELTRHFINFDLKHLKAANHCIKYLHVIKFLIIRYSNSESEKLNNQISSSNKEMSSTSNSKLNKKTSSNKKKNDKQIFEKTVDAFFANDLDRKSAEEYIFKLFDNMIDWVVKKQFIVSIFIIDAKLLSMLHIDKKLIWWIHFFQKLKFDSNQKIMIYNDNLQTIRFLISEILKIETKFRHVDIAQCWLRQSIQSDDFSINYLFIAKWSRTNWQRFYHHRNIENSLINWNSSMQNFWSKQSNAIKQDSFHINDERSLTKQLRINLINQQSQLIIRIRLKISNSLKIELTIFNSKTNIFDSH